MSTIETQALKDLKEAGYCILPDILDPVECDNLKSILDDVHRIYSPKYISAGGKPLNHGSQRGDKVVYNVHNKHRAFLKMIDYSPAYEILEKALQEGSYQNSEQVILRQAGARSPSRNVPPQQLHIDSRFPGCHFPIMVVAFWLLEDSTPDNGATRVVPGSHRRTRYPEKNEICHDEVQLTAKKGSVVLVDGGLWHAGGENQTDQTRWVLVFPYVRWFVKPSFDFNRNMPADFYDELTESQKRVLGYHCNPPIDEFTRVSTRTEAPDVPASYALPIL